MSEPGFGGTEMRTAELVPHLNSAGVEVHAVSLSKSVGEGPLVDTIQAFGGSIFPIPLTASFPISFLRLVRRLRPDIVHVDCANFSGVVLALAAMCGVSVRVAHFRGDDNQHRKWQRQAYRWVGGRLLRAVATHVLGVSPSSLTLGYHAGWQEDARCHVILNGLDIERLLRPGRDDLREMIGADPQDLVFINVGRGSAEKRRWLLPSVLSSLESHGVRAHMVLVGPRAQADEVRIGEVVADLGLADRVHHLGPRMDVGWLLRQADAVIHPSSLEGLPGGVLEPVALGVGTVAADIPGVRYIEQHLPGLTVVDVDAGPEIWASAALQAAGFTAAADLASAVEQFNSSVFAIGEAIARHLAIYRGQAPELVEAP